MRLLLILPVVLLLAGHAYAASFNVGVSPSVVEIGDISPGDERIVKFSIFTVSDEPLLVYLNTESGSMDFFNKGYKELVPKFSEEPTASWVEFLNNPIEIDTAAAGKDGRSWTEIKLLLRVPDDADPGYHVVSITPIPTFFGDKTDAPVGAAVISVTKVSILFNVKGDVKREGIILDTTAHGYNGRDFSLRTFFQNTGTTTLYASALNRIYDENSTLIGEFHSTREYTKPGKTAVFEAPVRELLEEGDYEVSTIVGFTTGNVEKQSEIGLYKFQAPEKSDEQKAQTPFIILIIAVLIIVIILLKWLREKRG